MVTHSSTSRPVQCLCMAERTGCPVFTDLWSYVFDGLFTCLIYAFTQRVIWLEECPRQNSAWTLLVSGDDPTGIKDTSAVNSELFRYSQSHLINKEQLSRPTCATGDHSTGLESSLVLP